MHVDGAGPPSAREQAHPTTYETTSNEPAFRELRLGRHEFTRIKKAETIYKKSVSISVYSWLTRRESCLDPCDP